MPKRFHITGQTTPFISLRVFKRGGVVCVHGITEDGNKEIHARLVDITPIEGVK